MATGLRDRLHGDKQSRHQHIHSCAACPCKCVAEGARHAKSAKKLQKAGKAPVNELILACLAAFAC